MDRIEGLQMYLRTAKTPRLNLAGAPEISAECFERLLPYAIALDAEAPWSEAFERPFARAPPCEDLRESYRPAWRCGARWSDAASAAWSAAASPRRRRRSSARCRRRRRRPV